MFYLSFPYRSLYIHRDCDPNITIDLTICMYIQPYLHQASIGPSVDDQAVSLSDDGTTIIIDFCQAQL